MQANVEMLKRKLELLDLIQFGPKKDLLIPVCVKNNFADAKGFSMKGTVEYVLLCKCIKGAFC